MTAASNSVPHNPHRIGQKHTSFGGLRCDKPVNEVGVCPHRLQHAPELSPTWISIRGEFTVVRIDKHAERAGCAPVLVKTHGVVMLQAVSHVSAGLQVIAQCMSESPKLGPHIHYTSRAHPPRSSPVALETEEHTPQWQSMVTPPSASWMRWWAPARRRQSAVAVAGTSGCHPVESQPTVTPPGLQPRYKHLYAHALCKCPRTLRLPLKN